MLAVASPAVRADGGHTALWAVAGRHNTVYLFGSVHVLRPEDSALPPAVQAAFARARTIVMEVAIDGGFAPEALRAAMLAQGLLPADQTLRALLGEELYRSLGEQAASLGLEVALLERFRPWVVALLLQQARLTRAGYAPDAGVEQQLARQARSARKPVLGLETFEEQLALFARLTDAQQRQFLGQTLAELDALDGQAGEIIAAWRSGDTARLGAFLARSESQSPELFHLLTTDRNRRWLPKVLELLESDADCLVIVGALHLVGPDGLLELLRQRGYQPVQH